MQRLITAADVCEYMGIATTDAVQPYIAIAEAMVAAYIDAPSLYARTRTYTESLVYDLDESEVIQLPDGPASSLVDLSVSGSVLELDSSGFHEDVGLGYWSLRYRPGFDRNSDVFVRYIAGFTPETLPLVLKEALVAATSLIQSRPNHAAILERIGDYTVQYNTAFNEKGLYGLDPRIMLLLRQFKRPFIG